MNRTCKENCEFVSTLNPKPLNPKSLNPMVLEVPVRIELCRKHAKETCTQHEYELLSIVHGLGVLGVYGFRSFRVLGLGLLGILVFRALGF